MKDHVIDSGLDFGSQIRLVVSNMNQLGTKIKEREGHFSQFA